MVTYTTIKDRKRGNLQRGNIITKGRFQLVDVLQY